MKSIKLLNSKKFCIYFNLALLAFAIVLLILNLDVFYVSHSSSGMIPVIVYETYSSVNTLFLYILIILLVINTYFYFTKKLRKRKTLRIIIISLSSLIPVMFLLLLIINPYFLIIFPVGSGSTRIIEIYVGLILIIVLYLAFFVNSILILLQERYLSKYAIVLSSIIGALLLSHAIHESGHALFVLISGGQVIEYFPLPFFVDGVLTTGYVSYQNVPPSLVPLVTLGGEILQWITILIILFILFRFNTPKPLTVFLSILLAISWLDFPLYTINNALGLPHWFILGCTHGDIMNFISQTGFPLWAMLFLASLQLLLGFIILYFKALKKFIPIKIRVKKKSTPLVDPF